VIDRDKVTELLKNYSSYRYAVRMFESKRTTGAPIASYDDMPRGGGYGSRTPNVNDGISLQDVMDYQSYKRAVSAIEGALQTLTDDEREVVQMKWMRGLTLFQVELRRHMGTNYARQIHRKALVKLAICLRFVEVPEILPMERKKASYV
jgi:DNA-directed RNA polymerase specialized sigma subunit